MKKLKWISLVIALMVFSLMVTACGEDTSSNSNENAGEITNEENSLSSDNSNSSEGQLGIETISLDEVATKESGADGKIDFSAVKSTNQDTIGWIYIPDTNIDAPVVCSLEELDYYENHNFLKEEDGEGAVYTQFFNNIDFSDCFTIIYGSTSENGNSGPFKELYRFTDTEFFNTHENLYVFTEKGPLTYEIISVFERDRINIMTEYDTTSLEDCNRYLSEEFITRKMGGSYREGWEGVNGTNYFLILTTSLGSNSNREYVLTAVLKDDPNGQLNRVIY